MLLTVKRAEDGNGIIVRFLEVRGKPATVRMKFPHLKKVKACSTNLVEKNLQPLQVDKNTVTVPIDGFCLGTIRISAD